MNRAFINGFLQGYMSKTANDMLNGVDTDALAAQIEQEAINAAAEEQAAKLQAKKQKRKAKKAEQLFDELQNLEDSKEQSNENNGVMPPPPPTSDPNAMPIG